MNIVEYANSFVNKASYVFGADNPDKLEFDCSSFTKYIYSKFGINIGRTTFEQVKQGKEIKISDAKPGDIIFFQNTYTAGVSHVGIYAGNDLFIHNSSSKKTVVVSSLKSSYYQSHFHSVRRLLDSDNEKDLKTDIAEDNSFDTTFKGSIAIILISFFVLALATFFFIQAFDINIF